MNYLAHLFCSRDTPHARLGNFLGDFVKGNIPEGRFPAEVVAGIYHHRSIDAFTDSNVITASSKKLISASRSRYAGIIIDVVFDHFLSTDWDRYSSTGLDAFIEKAYKDLGQHDVWIPHRAELVIEKMIREDWLRSYGTVEGIDGIFKRMARRGTGHGCLSSAVDDLKNHYAIFHSNFNEFFPILLSFVRQNQNTE